VGVGKPNSVRSGSSALQGEMELVVLWFSVHGPFVAQGDNEEERVPLALAGRYR
jgi:hypothetical protein